jgi:hypothetical protein
MPISGPDPVLDLEAISQSSLLSDGKEATRATGGLAGTSLDSRTLNARDRWGVAGLSGYKHSRPTRVQLLQHGRPSSHFTRLLRHVKLY